MRKILVIFISTVLFVCCENEDVIDNAVEKQNIILSTQTLEFDKNGNVTDGLLNKVIVDASSEWRLVGDTSWCKPYIVRGKNDAISFEPDIYSDKKERSVVFDFICGDAATKLTVIQYPEEFAEFVDSTGIKDSYEIPSSGGSIMIRLNSNLSSNDCELSNDWISLARPSDNPSGLQWTLFNVNPNSSFDIRKGSITMFKETDIETVFNVKQAAFIGLTTYDPISYDLDANGGSVTIKIRGNVDFDFSIDKLDTSWLSCKVVKEESLSETVIEKTYEISYTSKESTYSRRGIVKIKPTSGKIDGINIVITQKNPNPILFDVPDNYFANMLINKGYILSTNERYELTDAGSLLTSFMTNDENIKSMEGIENFVNLEELSIWYGSFKHLDVSKLTKLKELGIRYTPLENLILGDIAIEELELPDVYNSYTRPRIYPESFSISSTKLITLDFDGGIRENLKWIDVSGCPALKTLKYDFRDDIEVGSIYIAKGQQVDIIGNKDYPVVEK